MTATATGENLSYAEVVNDPALKLSPFERQCGLLWPEHQDVAAIAALVYPSEYAQRDADQADGAFLANQWKKFEREALRRVWWAVSRVFRRIEALYYGEMREAVQDYNRTLMAAYRNRRESGRTPETHAGVKPNCLLDDDKRRDALSLAELREANRDPQHFRPVSLRGATVTASVLKPLTPPERLMTLVRHLAAKQELAGDSVSVSV